MVTVKLYIYMNGYEVGEYIQQGSGAHEFIYSKTWLDRGNAAIPLSLALPLSDQKHRGGAVYNYFDNLLPDSQLIRNRIQTRFSTKTSGPFDLLAEIGRDCVGAIQLLPAQQNSDVKNINAIALSEEVIAKQLRNYRSLPLGMSADRDFRISLAGAQEKTALLWHNECWKLPIGTTPTTHIFKLPIGRIEHSGIDLTDSVENEWLCMQILHQFGLPVAATQIGTFEDTKALIIERFDRQLATDKSWIIRLPQEDMCQANAVAPALKYESDGGPGIAKIMDLLKSSLHPEADRKQFMQTVFLFWLLGAIDGHAKNFSIFLKQGGRFQLTPIYDVISAYPLAEKHQLDYQKVKMAMALHGKNTHYHWQNIRPRHWFAEAKRVDFPANQMEEIIEQTHSKLDKVIDIISTKLPNTFPENISQAIFQGMKKAAAKL